MAMMGAAAEVTDANTASLNVGRAEEKVGTHTTRGVDAASTKSVSTLAA